MNAKEILNAYKAGRLSITAVREKLREIEEQSFKSSLSEGQKGLWMLQKMSPGMSAYNVPLCVRIRPKLDIEMLKQACRFVLEQYPILTSVIREEDGIPYQFIQPSQPLFFQQEKLPALEWSEILAYLKMKAKEPISLENGPLVRIHLFSGPDQEHILLVIIHHIVFDGSSVMIFFKTLLEAYQKLLQGQQPVANPASATYKNFVEWEQKMMSDEEGAEHRSYWRNQLAGILPVIEIPPDHPRSSGPSFKGNTHLSYITATLGRKVKSYAQAHRVKPSVIFLGAFKVLLHRYTGQEDIIVGMPMMGRPQEWFDSLIGYFINMIPLRSQVVGAQSFAKFIQKLKFILADAMDHAVYPFPALVRELNVPRNTIHSPVFQVLFAYQNFFQSTSLQQLQEQYQDTISLEFIVDIHQEGEYEFELEIFEQQDDFVLNIKYNPDLFDCATISRMMRYYVQLIEEVVNRSDLEGCLSVAEIEILSGDEKKQLLIDFNKTETAYPQDKTIQELFEEQVKKTPDNPAVVFAEQTLTYRELNNKANQLAGILRNKGVKADSIVGIMVERSLEMIIGIIGISKAGGVYLPIDPEYPGERIAYMLEDSGTNILLTQKHLPEIASFKGEIIDINDQGLYQGDDTNLATVNNPQDLAYIIYTSGSTGKPKGVMVAHYNVVRLMANDRLQFDFNEKDVWTMFHSYCFDFSVWEMYGALLYGGKLVVVPGFTAKDPQKYLKLLNHEGVTVLNQTPGYFNKLAAEEIGRAGKDLSLRYVIFGGEALQPSMLKEWRKKYPGIKLINMYGITETTVHVTYKEITEQEIEMGISNIGRPIPTLTTYIMNKNLKLQPIGVGGELCVGGLGVAQGYLNRANLTKEKFIENPYKPGERLYRSGDLARMLPNGEMEYLGRIDQQVKIRGFRIELGEIEVQLLNHPAVKETVIIAKEAANGGKYLCAYYVAEQELAIAQLREHLAKTLPDYMIPSYFVQLPKIPLTPNGKTDRKALPEPGGNINTGAEYIAPGNEAEEILVQIWQEVLPAEQVGIKDNFFSLGGDSIKAIQVLSRLHNHGLKLEMQEFFKRPVIAELSSQLTLTSRQANQVLVEGEVGFTPIQSWLFAQSFKDKHHFNQAVILYSKKGFDEHIISRVFAKLTEHHDALRMVITTGGGNVVQRNRGLEGELYSLEVINLINNDNDTELIEKAADRIQASIDLQKGPLVKVGLFKTRAGDHLLIAIHHLVVDGISWRIILQDLFNGYMQASNNEEIVFPNKTDSFKDWSSYLATYANSPGLLNEVTYWTKLETTNVKPLPRDKTIEVRRNKDNANVQVQLTVEETKRLLKKVNSAYNTEINDILLTALGLAVKEWTGADRVLINLEGHGREEIIKDIDIQRTVGWFTTQYPVVLNMSSHYDLSYIIKSVKEELRRIPNKGIGYGVLKYLTLPEHKGNLRSELKPEINFNYLGQFDADIDTGVFSMSKISAGRCLSPAVESLYALDINGIVTDGRLTLNFTYHQGEYERDTIVKIAASFRNNLVNVIEHCTALQDAEMTPSDFTYKKLTFESLEKVLSAFE